MRSVTANICRPPVVAGDHRDAAPARVAPAKAPVVSKQFAPAPPRVILVPELHSDAALVHRRNTINDCGRNGQLWALMEGTSNASLMGVSVGQSGGLFGWEEESAHAVHVLQVMTYFATMQGSVAGRVSSAIAHTVCRFWRGVTPYSFSQFLQEALLTVPARPEMLEGWQQMPRPFASQQTEQLAQRFDALLQNGNPQARAAFCEETFLPPCASRSGAADFVLILKAWARTMIERAGYPNSYNYAFEPQGVVDTAWLADFIKLRNRGAAASAIHAYDLASPDGSDVWLMCGYAHVPGISDEIRYQRPDILVAVADSSSDDVAAPLIPNTLRNAKSMRRLQVISARDLNAAINACVPRATSESRDGNRTSVDAPDTPASSPVPEDDWELVDPSDL